MSSNRFLTKSRFKLALECSTKLFYTRNKDYPDKKVDDEFLIALAKGGFQVGELAKCYHPGGIDIPELDHEIALAKTNDLLKKENSIIYEAAFQYKNLFIRADIIIKDGKNIKLIEVKAKSIDSKFDELATNGKIKSKWAPYLYDVAFQKYVISKSYPDLKITSYLMLADKSKVTSVNGLNQKFFLDKDINGRTKVKIIGDTSTKDIGSPILEKIDVDDIISHLFSDGHFEDTEMSFIDLIHHYANHYESNQLLQESLGSQCNNCEFYLDPNEESSGLKDGFKECWKRVAKFKDEDFTKPSILNLWDFKSKDKYIKEGKYFLSQLNRQDLESKSSETNKSKKEEKSGLTRVDRQEMQISKAKDNDNTSYIDISGLKDTLNVFEYPLHFIDFETTSVAIPFNSGRRPYEQIAFQFSHHTVSKDGRIKHESQWINTKQGHFPNYEFVRELKKCLENDNGTIFRYSNHENTILNAIYKQLKSSTEKDSEELCKWIQSITKSTGGSSEKWEGERNMVDLWDLVKRFYFNPETNGSNSIKFILPAILNSSDFLKDKYNKPIYGNEINSLNFNNHTWITLDEKGNVINPYKKLEPIFKNIDQDLLDELVMEDDMELSDGGAAMTAYAQMQFTQMQQNERELIQSALLKYCELDTLAMVMIWEEWNNLINKN